MGYYKTIRNTNENILEEVRNGWNASEDDLTSSWFITLDSKTFYCTCRCVNYNVLPFKFDLCIAWVTASGT